MDSIERRYRANPYETTRLFTDDTERNTVYSRVDTLAQRNRMVGYPWTALKEAFYGEHASALLLVDYELLAQAPQRVLPLVYQFLGEPEYTHDFDQVSYDAPEFDEALGLHGLHQVRPQVGLQRRETILPPDLFEQYSKLSFWQHPANSRASVITPKMQPEAPLKRAAP
jgi:sulfotransferase